MLDFLLQHSPLLYLTQSVWRDEAFSVLMAEQPITTFFTKLSFEPPIYYILLHFWMKIWGFSEIAVRSLSFLGLISATIIIIYWSEKIFKKSWLSWFLPIFFITNPMLIYYGFEVRAYGWYIFFATLSMYAYLSQKWYWYIFAVVAGFYTHTYFLFTFAVQIIHYLIYNYRNITKKISFKTVINNPMIRAVLICTLAMAPWIIKVMSDLPKLRSSWYFPVDLQLITSVLGNLYLGYEGTPWYLWRYTFYLSLILLSMFTVALINPKTRKLNIYFFLNIFIPLFVVIGLSFVKPLFVNRYLISVTIAEVILLALYLNSFKNKPAQYLIGALMLSGSLWFNVWYPSQHAKFPYRQTMMQVNSLRGNKDVVYATSSLNYFETLYYSRNRQGVFFYNESGSAFPWYVGDAIFDASQMAYHLPIYPERAIIVTPEGNITISYKIVAKPDKTAPSGGQQ